MTGAARSLRDRILRHAFVQPEEDRILSMAASVDRAGGSRALDVGCGFGAKLKRIVEAGWDADGVDVNVEAVRSVRQEGLTCFTEEEFAETSGVYDVILMSHIIEHFDADALVGFMDSYLDRLRPGGGLIIASPVLTRRFFEDPDHVRPYYPGSILMLYGKGEHQIRLRGRHKLRLVDLWYRRHPWSIAFARDLKVSRGVTLPGLFNLFLATVHLATFRVAGSVTGWVGLFRKEENGGGE